MSKMIEMKSHVVTCHKRRSLGKNVILTGPLYSQCKFTRNQIVVVITRFLQSPSVIRWHLFFGWVTRFAVQLVNVCFARLDFQRPDHSGNQANEAMQTLDLGGTFRHVSSGIPF